MGAYSEECGTAVIIAGAAGLGTSIRIEEQWNGKGPPTARTEKSVSPYLIDWYCMRVHACGFACIS